MPCENCHVQFTVFRRKRICHDCKRFYCNNCLIAAVLNKRNALRCQRCAIFAKRPLLRADLLQLKPKDLIFYLQSKHISTAGCVEKEELVGLVISHVAQMQSNEAAYDSAPNSPTFSSSGSSEQQNTHSFDSLKQTCQNFFSSLSDNISDSFVSSFDTSKPTANKNANNRQSNNSTGSDTRGQSTATHIFEQPRVSTREIPTYASFQNGQPMVHNTTNPTPSTSINIHISNDGPSSRTAASATLRPSTSNTLHDATNLTKTAEDKEDRSAAESDCECSDDEELIATYNEHLTLKAVEATNKKLSIDSKLTANESNVAAAAAVEAGPSTTTTTINNSPGVSKQESLSSKVDVCGADVSSQSSFEELGAIGGVSDDSKTATDTNSSNMEQWQILDAQRIEEAEIDEVLEVTVEQEVGDKEESTSSRLGVSAVSVETSATDQQVEETMKCTQSNAIVPPPRTKKVIRRRSDGYLNRRHHSSEDDESPMTVNLATLPEQTEIVLPQQQQTRRNSCQRCGKNKTNIKRHVEKLRSHLESSQMSEQDIKRELQEFLTYLEQRTKSMDCSDTESRAVSSLSGFGGGGNGGGGTSSVSGMPRTPTIEFSPTPTETDLVHLDDNDGIHVYASSAGFEAAAGGVDSRFVNLEDFEDIKDLENLTVKQLKEVLMLHRVDYKGCCEKQELLDRVGRLWKTMRTAPAVEKLPTDELCKICMDAPIECVFLECGHMATCTNCGKVLNECPICRQYIVRVVRFFRA